jgi:hypothetical protein
MLQNSDAKLHKTSSSPRNIQSLGNTWGQKAYFCYKKIINLLRIGGREEIHCWHLLSKDQQCIAPHKKILFNLKYQ